jgi:hypothetical protein
VLGPGVGPGGRSRVGSGGGPGIGPGVGPGAGPGVGVVEKGGGGWLEGWDSTRHGVVEVVGGVVAEAVGEASSS